MGLFSRLRQRWRDSAYRRRLERLWREERDREKQADYCLERDRQLARVKLAEDYLEWIRLKTAYSELQRDKADIQNGVLREGRPLYPDMSEFITWLPDDWFSWDNGPPVPPILLL